jgi:hypothetical protein
MLHYITTNTVMKGSIARQTNATYKLTVLISSTVQFYPVNNFLYVMHVKFSLEKNYCA